MIIFSEKAAVRLLIIYIPANLGESGTRDPGGVRKIDFWLSGGQEVFFDLEGFGRIFVGRRADLFFG